MRDRIRGTSRSKQEEKRESTCNEKATQKGGKGVAMRSVMPLG